MQFDEKFWTRLALVVGAIGALCGVAGDFFSTYSAAVPGGVPYDWESVLELVAAISPERQLLGKTFAVLGMQLSIWGFGVVILGCRGVGMKWTVPALFVMVFIYFVGVSYHSQLSLLGSALQYAEATGTMSDPATIKMLAEHRAIMWNQLTIVEIGIGFLSIWLPVVVLTGKTVYPKWFAVMSPFPVMGVLVGIVKVLGIEPLRMFVELCVFNIIAFVLMVVAAFFLWTPEAELPDAPRPGPAS